MSAQSAHLTLRPDRCDQCMRCVAACPNDALRVGQDYILVDWHACNQCSACVEACDARAIQRAVVPLRSRVAAPSVAAADVAKVVVGSRAEAKAMRKAAEQAAKQSARAASKPDFRLSVTPSASARVDGAPQAARGALFGAPWEWVDVAAILVVFALALLGKEAVLGLHSVGLMPASGRALTRTVVLAVYYAVQLGALALLARRHGSTLVTAFRLERTAPGDVALSDSPSVVVSVGLALVLLVGVEVVAISYGLIAQSLGWSQPITLASDVSAVFGVGAPGLFLSILFVALVAPFVEEFAFRGVVLGVLGERWGMWPGIIASAAIFAAYHLSLWMFFPMLVLGVALGWLAVSRRSLWPAIGLHAAYNAVAVAATFLVRK